MPVVTENLVLAASAASSGLITRYCAQRALLCIDEKVLGQIPPPHYSLQLRFKLLNGHQVRINHQLIVNDLRP